MQLPRLSQSHGTDWVKRRRAVLEAESRMKTLLSLSDSLDKEVKHSPRTASRGRVLVSRRRHDVPLELSSGCAPQVCWLGGFQAVLVSKKAGANLGKRG